MELSIIIVTWNSEEFVGSCLESILGVADESQFEIIVVDNASSDRTISVVHQFLPRVKLIENKKNLGYAQANNQGIEKSTSEYVLLLNPDTQIQKDALGSMLRFMETNPEIGALGPQLLNPDGSVQPSCREFPKFSTLIWEFSGASRIFSKSKVFGRWRMGYFAFDRRREVDQPMGSCLMLRSRTLKQVGLFDGTFSMFFNDVDLCYRIKNAGWKIFFYPHARVLHHKGASTIKAKRRMIWLSHWAFYKFFRKHKKGWRNRLFLLLLLVPLLLSALPRMILKR